MISGDNALAGPMYCILSLSIPAGDGAPAARAWALTTWCSCLILHGPTSQRRAPSASRQTTAVRSSAALRRASQTGRAWLDGRLQGQDPRGPKTRADRQSDGRTVFSSCDRQQLSAYWTTVESALYAFPQRTVTRYIISGHERNPLTLHSTIQIYTHSQILTRYLLNTY